jgi:putative nucleotidyltransferase with HDIG domain/PAS domain S-box-containing protein
MFGCQQDEIINSRPTDFSPPTQPDGRNSAESAAERIQAALEGKPQFFEWKHCKLDRTPFDAEVSLSLLELEEGTFIQAIVRDITERKRTEKALADAYDTTLEGWAKALELRDKETEGHSRRVTETTLVVARAMGFSEEELVHIRRGCILHDIGKMGVPDDILRKKGPLTDEERAIVNKHPITAHELLRPITYLEKALDIPYCHHERWDGKGYPRGLVGQEIPLAARIFAVVDVWDALRSDRPYRDAWAPEKVVQYLIAESGKHFDGDIVRVFLRTIEQGGI